MTLCAPAGRRIHLRHRHLARIVRELSCEPSDMNEWYREIRAHEEPPDPFPSCYLRPHGGCLAWTMVWDEDKPEQKPYAAKCTLEHDHGGYHRGQEVAGEGGGSSEHIWLDPGDHDDIRTDEGMARLHRYRWCADPTRYHHYVPQQCRGARTKEWVRMHRFVLDYCPGMKGRWLDGDRLFPYSFVRDCYVFDPLFCLHWTYEDDIVEEGEQPRIVGCIYQRGHGDYHSEGCMMWSPDGTPESAGKVGEDVDEDDADKGPKPEVWWCGPMPSRNVCRLEP